MANFKVLPLFFFISVLLISSLQSLCAAPNDGDRKVYIVYMGSLSDKYSLTSDYHLGILQQVLEGRSAEESLVRSYRRSFNGFAANLTEKELQNLKNMKEVVSVFPSRTLQLQTTRSWDFLGFIGTSQKDGINSAESNIIVGVIDSGVWPESQSFRDDGFGPPPKKWKGVCNGGRNFTCNNKLIGARSYSSTTARDDIGHGSHTASTAAGRKVENASFYGLANGTARGGAPSARISAYKVCNSQGCSESDILAAFDDAIADGVDLITISIGGERAVEFDYDGIAIGGFHAMAKGILTLHSAGNSGNQSSTLCSVAPWLFTIAASTMDRHIIGKVSLGDGTTLIGNSINSFKLKGDKFPLVYGKDASISGCDEQSARSCSEGCLDSKLVKGKIVVCNEMGGGGEALTAGALGILTPTSREDVSFIFPLPGVSLRAKEFDALLTYLDSTKNPVGNILKSESANDTRAPVVASFSSRGPNTIASDILKPDITAPGVEILAAYSESASVSDNPEDKRSVKYSVLSGTSMSCPHVAGAAAYLKSLHPDWSPAAIKSALMTTASPMSPSKNPDGEFAYGAGHINPTKAANPGLVYEADKDDYVKFLCKLGYTDEQIKQISGDTKSSCSGKSNNDESSSPKDINYPSLSAIVDTEKAFTVKFERRVTNIGVANSTYTAKVESKSSLKITVEPKILSFKSLKEEKSFSVSVVGKGLSYGSLASASLVWSDGIHNVRSPIVVYVA